MRLVVLRRMLRSELICKSKAEMKVSRLIGNVKILVSLAADKFITAQTTPDDVRATMNFNWKNSLAPSVHPEGSNSI